MRTAWIIVSLRLLSDPSSAMVSASMLLTLKADPVALTYGQDSEGDWSKQVTTERTRACASLTRGAGPASLLTLTLSHLLRSRS